MNKVYFLIFRYRIEKSAFTVLFLFSVIYKTY